MKTEWLLLTWFPGREDSGWRAKTCSCPISVWSVAGLHQGSFNILTTLAQCSFSAVLPYLTLQAECPLLKCPLVPPIPLLFSISSGLRKGLTGMLGDFDTQPLQALKPQSFGSYTNTVDEQMNVNGCLIVFERIWT